jgi:hypothetical protein
MSYNSSFSDSGFGSSFDSVGFAVSTDFQACGPLGPLLKPVNIKRLVVYVLAGVDVTNIKCGIGSRPEDDAAL